MDTALSRKKEALVMKCVSGGSLLQGYREGSVHLEEAIDLASQLCGGLAT